MDSGHAGHRERLRARFAENGLAGFAEHEVLELLLTYAIPRINTNPLAHRLLRQFGSLAGVLEASQKDLEAVEGIGPQASTLIALLLPLFRAYEQRKLIPRRQFSTYADIAAYCRTLFLGVGWEEFYVLSLDGDMRLLAVKRISRGTPTEVSVLPRLVLQELLQSQAAGAVITHNHPSGKAAPSQEDVDMTAIIEQLLAGVGIRLYDHVLVADGQTYSFLSHHWLGGAPQAEAEETRSGIAADHPQWMLPPRESGRKQK